MRKRHRNPTRRNGGVVLVMAAPVEIVTFEDSDFNCVPVNAAPVAVPLPDIEIPGTTGSLPITRVGNEPFELVGSATGVDMLLMLSRNVFMLSPGLIAKTIPRSQCDMGMVSISGP